MSAFRFERLNILKEDDEQRDIMRKNPDVYESESPRDKSPARLFFSSPCLLPEFEDE